MDNCYFRDSKYFLNVPKFIVKETLRFHYKTEVKKQNLLLCKKIELEKKKH